MYVFGENSVYRLKDWETICVPDVSLSRPLSDGWSFRSWSTAAHFWLTLISSLCSSTGQTWPEVTTEWNGTRDSMLWSSMSQLLPATRYSRPTDPLFSPPNATPLLSSCCLMTSCSSNHSLTQLLSPRNSTLTTHSHWVTLCANWTSSLFPPRPQSTQTDSRAWA